MYDNSEKLCSLNKTEFFGKMLKEISWSNLRDYIQGNSQMTKACLFGGQRLDPQHRARLEERVVREAEKSGYSDAVVTGIFRVWYPVHTELHNSLETYFYSDAYKTYRSDNGLTEDDYVLSDEKFNEFFSVNELNTWRILLFFSPMKFSDEQANKVIECTQGSGELLEKIAALESELASANRKLAQQTADLDKATTAQNDATAEIQNLKRQNRDGKVALDALQQKLDSSQGEVKRLNAKLADIDLEATAVEKQALNEAQRKMERALADVARVTNELQTWKSKYEEQRIANRQLEENSQRINKDIAAAETNSQKIAEQLASVQNFIDALLSRIDWPAAGSAMKLSPTIRRNFNSLIKKLNYEEDGKLSIEGTLPQFWSSLSAQENALVKKIAESNVQEVAAGNMEQFWNEICEEFQDVQISIEAKLFLISTLHEIFFQTFGEEDLKKVNIPATKKK